MKVVHVCYSDANGGAAIGAYRLHHAMRHRGVNSHMVVVDKQTEDETVTSVVHHGNRDLYRSFNRATDEIRDLYGVPKLPIRSINIFGPDTAETINCMNPDVVQLHWIGNNTLKISDLPAIQAPIVWKMPDMWAFCGGEHYNRFGDPERFAEGYDRTLPFQGEKTDVDQLVWEHKRKYYADLPLTITSPSAFLAECAHRSVLLNAYDCIVIPNPLPWAFIEGYPAQDAERDELRARFGLPSNKTLVCFSLIRLQNAAKATITLNTWYRNILAAWLPPTNWSL